MISHTAFSIVLGVTAFLHFFYITQPCHGVLLPLTNYFLLLKSTHSVCFNILNITVKITPVETYSFYRFLLVIHFTCIVHFRMHSPSVEKPNLGVNFLFHHSALGLSKITPYFCSPLKYHTPGAAHHHFIASPPLFPQNVSLC